MPFENATRQKFVTLPTIVYPAGGGLQSIQLPKSGLLARLWLEISITVGGTVNTPNPLGICSAIRRVKVSTNAGIDIVNISGVSYFYALQYFQEYGGPNGLLKENQGGTAVSAATFNLDMLIPLQINMHDSLGLIMLQDDQLQLTLSIEWETPTNIGGSTATVTAGSVIPHMEFFTVPADPADYPNLTILHSTIEEQIAIAATGDFPYNFPRSNVYLQALFLYGVASAGGADNWSRSLIRINQADIIQDINPNLATMLMSYRNGITRPKGVFSMDLLGSDGLGAYGTARDFINSKYLTDFQNVITTTATGTLYVVRRMLVPLEQPAQK